MRNKSIICLLFVSYFITARANHDQDISQQLDSYMQALTKLNRFSGSVVVAKGDTILLNKGYGFASHEFEVPNSAQTKFRICSITKMVTAVAIMQLQERGLLNVQDPINKYIPDYPRGNEITIHHLLTHTSGLFPMTSGMPLEMTVMPVALEKIINYCKDRPLLFEPGARFEYSNAGYALLSYIIERVSAKSYEDFIGENILQPLAMIDSCFGNHDNSILKQCASGYEFNKKGTLTRGHYMHESALSGYGGLYCSAQDLYAFARALSTGRLINKESFQCMSTPYTNTSNYGYGCNIQNMFSNKLIEHAGGSSTGFRSNVSLFINDEVTIAITSNFLFAWVYEIRDALAAIVFRKAYEFPGHTIRAIDPTIYNEYIGTYDHPDFNEPKYQIIKKDDKLVAPENIELICVGKDTFCQNNKNMRHMLYTFIRNEEGNVVQLRIKGGSSGYFEVRCEKI